MINHKLRHHISQLLTPADVRINGSRPWDIRVNNDSLYQMVLARGSLGFGEAYMNGWWETGSLDQLIYRLIRAQVDKRCQSLTLWLSAVKARLLNRQSLRRAFEVGEKHYNIGNDLYQRMLDERMIYSCAYWKDAVNLDQAQENKLALSGRKLQLEPGQRILDIGCGWGGTARYLAERFGVEVVGITISTAQAEFARENCRGLPIEIMVQDYRRLEGSFDRVVSIGMFEHVGHKNYLIFFRKIASLLKDGGLFLLHTIGGNQAATQTDPWIDKYIFPNGTIPSARQISKAFEGLFILEDWHSFGLDYDKTLLAWYNNFKTSWPDLQNRYSERFQRMWTYYLLSCAGAFRARSNQLWQIVLSKKGLTEPYPSPR